MQSVVARVSPRRLVELELADDAASLATEAEVLPKTADKLVLA